MAGQQSNQDDDPAISLYFKVTIDDHDIGSFTSCRGLSFDIAIEQVEEGGNNAFVHKLPGRINYSNVTFTRAVNRDSAKLARWFASMHGQIRRTTASISAMSADGDHEIATWTLQGVIPVKWSGPELNADRGSVATESFEIAHHGFLEA